MNRKVLLSMLLIGVLMFGVGMGTYAYFTSVATSENNLFETGTLEIGDINTMDQVTIAASSTGIYPGWTSGVKTINVNNNGTLELQYRMSVSQFNDTAIDSLPASMNTLLYDGATPLQVSINGGTPQNINALGVNGFVNLGTIPANQSGTFTIEFSLPTAANNLYKNATGDFDFLFEATQVGNNAYTESGL
ncbi:TasA family protein [Anaeromicrobium sediminis]|nr:TasA family protein [Anaeromicrobium sediminis]